MFSQVVGYGTQRHGRGRRVGQGSDVGAHSVQLVVQDSGGLSDTQAFSIAVRAASDPPDPDPANTLFLPLVRR